MNKEKIKKIYIYSFAIFALLLVAFYFLAGDQIRYRDSRSNINLPIAEEIDGSTDELVSGVVIEQKFFNLIDRIKDIKFYCTTHYRENKGTMSVELLNDNELLISKNIDVSQIKENEPVVIESDKYLEGYLGKELTIRLTSNSSKSNGISPLTFSYNPNGTILKVNNRSVVGGLAFGVYGQEFIFTGQYYWLAVGILCLLFGGVLLASYRKYIKNGSSYIVRVIFAIERYNFLISQLVSRDFKTKYKRSVLGVFWSFLNPLLTMLVQFIVFSKLFRNSIDNYPVYLLIGVICFNFFREVTDMSLGSITGNANLIKKVYMPRYIYPLSRTISSSINLGISLLPLLIVCLLTGVRIKQSVILALFFFVCLIIFSLGVGMLLSALNVFFRDVQFLWSVIVMMWMYATPLFYSEDIIPERFYFIIRLNPIYHFIKNIRICVMNGVSPQPRAYAYCFIFALISLLLGSYVFKKNQDKFTLYL